MRFERRTIEIEAGFSFQPCLQSNAAALPAREDDPCVKSSLIALAASGALTMGLIVLSLSLMFERAIAAPLF